MMMCVSDESGELSSEWRPSQWEVTECVVGGFCLSTQLCSDGLINGVFVEAANRKQRRRWQDAAQSQRRCFLSGKSQIILHSLILQPGAIMLQKLSEWEQWNKFLTNNVWFLNLNSLWSLSLFTRTLDKWVCLEVCCMTNIKWKKNVAEARTVTYKENWHKIPWKCCIICRLFK